MAVLLFLRSDKAAYYVAYVLTFNLLVGPVFSAGSITQERERQTLCSLAHDPASPGPDRLCQADGLAAGFDRADVPAHRADAPGLHPACPSFAIGSGRLLAFLLIIATTCLATSTIGLMCSALARRTSTAMVVTYLTLLILFVVPLGLELYLRGISSVTEEQLAAFTVTSPFSAAAGRADAHDPKRDLER